MAKTTETNMGGAGFIKLPKKIKRPDKPQQKPEESNGK